MNQKLMREIDEQYLRTPFYGSRQMTYELQNRGYPVGRKRIRRLMRLQGLTPVYPRPRTSEPAPGHRIYPYRLRGLSITEPDHVWCADITYLPVDGSHFYLVAVMDWATRAVLSWRLSNTMDSSFCIEALEEALKRFGPPKIFNTDQGSQFTSEDFLNVLEAHEITISMDGRSRWLDNVFIERLWRSLKSECVHLAEWRHSRQVRAEISRWIEFCNHCRPHSEHRGQSPGSVYGLRVSAVEAADLSPGAARRPSNLGKRFALPTTPTALAPVLLPG